LATGAVLSMWRPMSRAAIAVPLGLFGFVLYVGTVVALADHVLGLHWAVQLAFFLVAGIAWALPARRLLLWAGEGRR
jgi:uncharacterized protein DUF2842